MGRRPCRAGAVGELVRAVPVPVAPLLIPRREVFEEGSELWVAMNVKMLFLVAPPAAAARRPCTPPQPPASHPRLVAQMRGHPREILCERKLTA